MVDQDENDIMQINNEVSAGWPKPLTAHYNTRSSGNASEGLTELKEQEDVHSAPVEQDNLLSKDVLPPNHGYNNPFNQQEFFTLPNYSPDIQKLRQSQTENFESHFYLVNRDYPYIENRIHYLPFRMFCQGYQHGRQYQEFQYFVVIDFEATCDKETKPHPQEIIEFPSVLVNSMTGQLEASFQTYVRPVYHQHLTDFCKELTGIQQIQVDRGVPLSEALLMHDKWLEDKGIKHKNFAVVTWGDWDCRVMLESECRVKRIRKPPYFNRWINLKVPFQDMFGGVRCNLKEAVELAGLAWEGRPHSGLDDARNTAHLLTLLMHRGFRLSITNSLVWQDPPLASQQFLGCPAGPVTHPQKPKDLTVTSIPYHPFIDPNGRERCTYCFCGVLSSKCVIRKPGPTQGRCFFGCGNWTASRRAVCNYFAWASP